MRMLDFSSPHICNCFSVALVPAQVICQVTFPFTCPTPQEDLSKIHNYLKGGCTEVGPITSDMSQAERMRGNYLKFCHGRFRLSIRKNFTLKE